MDATDKQSTGTISGMFAGALLGGIAWGLLAAKTIGAPHEDPIDTTAVLKSHLIAAAMITALCLYATKTLWPEPNNTPGAILRRQMAMTLATAPIGGWAYLLLQYVQH